MKITIQKNQAFFALLDAYRRPIKEADQIAENIVRKLAKAFDFYEEDCPNKVGYFVKEERLNPLYVAILVLPSGTRETADLLMDLTLITAGDCVCGGEQIEELDVHYIHGDHLTPGYHEGTRTYICKYCRTKITEDV